MTFLEISEDHKLSNPLRLLFQIGLTFHGRGFETEVAECSNIQKEEYRTGQKLEVNDRHEVLKAFYCFIADLSHDEQTGARKVWNMKI